MKNLFSLFAQAKHFVALAIVALFVMACNNSATPPDIPDHDYSVATKASKDVIAVMGKTKAEAQKAILDAGFQEVDENMFNAPQRVIRLERAAKEDEDVICFAFNLTPDMVDMTEKEIVNKIIDSKTTAILFVASFKNGYLSDIQGRLIIGAEIGHVNTLYLECSEAIHSSLGVLGTWSAVVKETEYENKEVEYKNFNKFYKAVADMNAVYTQEKAGCIFNITGTRQLGYAITWNKPNEAETREQISKGYKTAYAEAGFALNYTDSDLMD